MFRRDALKALKLVNSIIDTGKQNKSKKRVKRTQYQLLANRLQLYNSIAI